MPLQLQTHNSAHSGSGRKSPHYKPFRHQSQSRDVLNEPSWRRSDVPSCGTDEGSSQGRGSQKSGASSKSRVISKSLSNNDFHRSGPSPRHSLERRRTSLESLPTTKSYRSEPQTELKPDWKEAMAKAIRESQGKDVSIPNWVVKALSK